jgi:hypothetical protein
LQFRNPLMQGNPNDFLLQVPTTSLEGGTSGGDSGGPLFAEIGGQLIQIGVVRGGNSINYCRPPSKTDAVPCDQDMRPDTEFVGSVTKDGYGVFSDWTPISTSHCRIGSHTCRASSSPPCAGRRKVR